MAFTTNINASNPTGSENANTIDDIIREVRLQMKERFDSLTTGCDIDPMRLKAGAIPSGYTIDSPNFTGTPTGIALSRVSSALATTNSGITTSYANVLAITLTAGTWLLCCSASVQVAGNASSTSLQALSRLRNAAATDVFYANGSVGGFSAGVVQNITIPISKTVIVTTSGETFNWQFAYAGGTSATVQGDSTLPNATLITAVRLA